MNQVHEYCEHCVENCQLDKGPEAYTILLDTCCMFHWYFISFCTNYSSYKWSEIIIDIWHDYSPCRANYRRKCGHKGILGCAPLSMKVHGKGCVGGGGGGGGLTEGGGQYDSVSLND